MLFIDTRFTCCCQLALGYTQEYAGSETRTTEIDAWRHNLEDCKAHAWPLDRLTSSLYVYSEEHRECIGKKLLCLKMSCLVFILPPMRFRSKTFASTTLIELTRLGSDGFQITSNLPSQ